VHARVAFPLLLPNNCIFGKRLAKAFASTLFYVISEQSASPPMNEPAAQKW
jgi:hypothetical protein